jgi:general secretion pathway protein J
MGLFQQPVRLEMKHKTEKGFTLLESLVALALLSLICAVLYSTYFGLTRARERGLERMESSRELRTTLDMIRKDIASAFFNKSNKRLHFIVKDRDSFGRPSSTLDLTTFYRPSTNADLGSGLAEVKYQPLEKEKKLVLTRQARDIHFSSKPVPYPQMEELEGFLVECFDGSQWVRTWNTSLNNVLPKAVRITIRVKDGKRTVEFFTISNPKVQDS